MKIDAQALLNTTQQGGREPPAGQRQAQWQQAVERAHAHRLAQQSSMAAPAVQRAQPTTAPAPGARPPAVGGVEASRGMEAALRGVGVGPELSGRVAQTAVALTSPRAAEPGGVGMAPRERRPPQGEARAEADASVAPSQPRQTDRTGPLDAVCPPRQDDVAIDARWGDDGVMVEIRVPRARLAERESIIAAVMQHFSLHGVRVSRVACNQEVVFENTRGADALVRVDL